MKKTDRAIVHGIGKANRRLVGQEISKMEWKFQDMYEIAQLHGLKTVEQMSQRINDLEALLESIGLETSHAHYSLGDIQDIAAAIKAIRGQA